MWALQGRRQRPKAKYLEATRFNADNNPESALTPRAVRPNYITELHARLNHSEIITDT